MANIDGEPGLEIIANSAAQGPLYAWDAKGKVLPGWPVFPDGYAYPVAGQLSSTSPGDEVVAANFGNWGRLSAFHGGGHPATGHGPRHRHTSGYASSASLSDVDGDGLDEIFMVDAYSMPYQVLRNGRAGGDPLPGWPVPLVSSERTGTFPPAIADLDGDGHPEIIYGDNQHQLHARRAAMARSWLASPSRSRGSTPRRWSET